MFQTHFMMGQINMAPSQKRKSCEHNPELLICWQFFWGFQFLVRFSKESSHGELLTGEKIILADQNKAGETESQPTHCLLVVIYYTHTHTQTHNLVTDALGAREGCSQNKRPLNDRPTAGCHILLSYTRKTHTSSRALLYFIASVVNKWTKMNKKTYPH